ncbi:hypothetical protein [Flavobacterium sp.]|uniref:hypothetical protein n=1 Tax=Flavobacterium sp. TaxID=239 RepID=UPI004047B694
MIFEITESNKIENNIWTIVCKATFENLIVGFRLFIIDNIDPGINEDKIDETKFVKDGLSIIGIGEESNNFLYVISKLYEIPNNQKFTNEKLLYTVFPLNNNVAKLSKGKFNFKVFYDDSDEKKLYSEFYINIDLKNKIVEFNEKDEDYRKNIIKTFSQ